MGFGAHLVQVDRGGWRHEAARPAARRLALPSAEQRRVGVGVGVGVRVCGRDGRGAGIGGGGGGGGEIESGRGVGRRMVRFHPGDEGGEARETRGEGRDLLRRRAGEGGGGLAVASGGRQAVSAAVRQGSVDLGANLGQSRRGSTSNSVMRIDRSEST